MLKAVFFDRGHTFTESEWKKQEREIAKIFKPDAIVKNFQDVIPITKKL